MLVVDGIRRSFGTVAALDGVSFATGRGEVFGLLGPNGAGKTTTMRTILGIYAPDAGSVTWDGAPVDDRVRRRFGYLPEERGLYGKMRVRDQLAYFGRLHGLSPGVARARTARWIERLDLGTYANRPCGELSKGNQQKVQLACAVLHEPDLLVLDEPFSGLDPLNARAMLDCIRELAAGGTALVLSSHQMFAIENACRSFCILAAGRVRIAGTLAELRAAFPMRRVRVAPDSPGVRRVVAAAGATSFAPGDDGSLACDVPAATDFGALLRAAAAAGPLDAFDRREPTLDEIYVGALARPPA